MSVSICVSMSELCEGRSACMWKFMRVSILWKPISARRRNNRWKAMHHENKNSHDKSKLWENGLLSHKVDSLSQHFNIFIFIMYNPPSLSFPSPSAMGFHSITCTLVSLNSDREEKQPMSDLFNPLAPHITFKRWKAVGSLQNEARETHTVL